VDERLDRLGVIHVAADPDRAAGRVGPAVGPAGVTAVHRVAVPDHLPFQGVPQPGRCLPGQQGRSDVGQRRPLGLGQGEHVHHAEAPYLLPATALGCRSPAAGGDRLLPGWSGRLGPLGRLRAVGARRQDRDAPLPLAYLPAQALPAAEPGHPGGLRGLCADQQQVAQAVAVELRGGVQHRPPPWDSTSAATPSLICSCNAASLSCPRVVWLVVLLVCVLVLI